MAGPTRVEKAGSSGSIGAAVSDSAGRPPPTWSGHAYDWAFSLFATSLVAAGYYDSWINRHLPVRPWEHAPAQASWMAVTTFLVLTALVSWRQGKARDSLLPSGYLLPALGCAIFAAGMLISGWWTTAFGTDFGVPGLFRPPTLLQIGGAVLIVTGPLRAAVARGELLARPPAVLSAALILASITFFTQFDHPYVNEWAADKAAPPFPLDFMREELGALGLMLQTTAVTGVILVTLRQIRLPLGAVAFMLIGTALLVCTQLGDYWMLLVAGIVGVSCEVLLILARPRADRIVALRLFAVATGALLAGVYLVFVAVVKAPGGRPTSPPARCSSAGSSAAS